MSNSLTYNGLDIRNGDISMNIPLPPTEAPFSNGIYLNGPNTTNTGITSMIFSIYRGASECFGSIRYGNSAIYMSAGGNIGINNNNPQYSLDVSGELNCSGPGYIDITPNTADDSNKIATTEFVKNQAYAKLASPAFSGTPTAPTPASNINTTQIPTTAFVKNQFYTPVGSIIMMVQSSQTTPSNYLYCNGSSYPITGTYSSLFGVIGYTFGGSSPSFFVPDFRGAFLRGQGTNGTETTYIGNAIGTYQLDQLQTHTHYTIFGGPGANQQAPQFAPINSGNTTNVSTSEPSGNIGTETRPFNYSVYYYIRYL